MTDYTFVNLIENLKYSEVDSIRCGHLLDVLETIALNKIPGDLVETGIYKGGTACIISYANEVFKMNRDIWLCDSFQGCPDPELTKYGKHKDELHGKGDFSYPLVEVKKNMESLSLLTDKIHFVEGWFQDTMPLLPSTEIALLRFDGDLYSSTLEVLEELYPKVVKGGYVIIDDYCIEACRVATHEYLDKHSIKVEIQKPFVYSKEGGIITGDACGSWWIK